jgi:hypothetical protein
LLTQFTWTLACGLGLTVTVGGLARLAHVPVPVYVISLHALMLVMAVSGQHSALSTQHPAPSTQHSALGTANWELRTRLPLYALVALCCVIMTVVAGQRNHLRFDGYEDQTVFASDANWLANDPDDPGIRARRAGVTVGDPRSDTDGWTYNHAAWVWASGVPAHQLIWYDLTALFAWTIPLFTFALAYELTGRVAAGAWSAAALTLLGLLTIDSFVYIPNNMAFGQATLFQLNTLRAFSRGLMLPLALFTILMYLRAPRRRDLVLVILTGIALAFMHPQQMMVLNVVAGATAAVWWLARPARARLMAVIGLGLALMSFVGLSYWQRAAQVVNTSGIAAYNARVEAQLLAEERSPIREGGVFVTLRLPVVGATFILRPEVIFYHPVIAAGAAVGLLFALGWRRSLAAQYIFAATAVALLLMFTPGLTRLFVRLTYTLAAPGLVFALPIPLAFGLGLDALVGFARRRVRSVPSAEFQVLSSEFSVADRQSSAPNTEHWELGTGNWELFNCAVRRRPADPPARTVPDPGQRPRPDRRRQRHASAA